MPLMLADDEWLEMKNVFGALISKLPNDDEKVQAIAAAMTRLYGLLDERARGVPLPAIGDRPAFPVGGFCGMTYRQWLIGQAVAGLMTNGEIVRTEKIMEQSARIAVTMADLVLWRLDRETLDKKSEENGDAKAS